MKRRIVFPTDGPIPPIVCSVAEFLNALFAAIGLAGFIEIRVMTTKAGALRLRGRRWIRWDGTPLDASRIPSLPARQHVYYGVALRKERGQYPGVGGLANCHETDALIVDLDIKSAARFKAAAGEGADVLTMSPDALRAAVSTMAREALGRLEELGLPPMAVVYTGHGLHFIFRLPSVIAHELTRTYTKLIGNMLGAEFGYDVSTAEVSHHFRLYGSDNAKNPSRPMKVELWGLVGEVRVDPTVLDSLLPKQRIADTCGSRSAVGRNANSVIRRFNVGVAPGALLTAFGYRQLSERRFTRPGDGASGGDVHLIPNAHGVLCSYHHSSNDPIRGTPGDGHLRTSFDLLRDLKHDGNQREALHDAGEIIGIGLRPPTPEAGRPQVNPTDGAAADSKAHPERRSISTRLVNQVLNDGGELWHDRTRNSFMSVQCGDHWEHYRLPSEAATDYLRMLHYRREGEVPSSQALNEVSIQLATMARVEGPERVSGMRVARSGDRTFIDLGGPTWQVVEVGEGGWRVIPSDAADIRFIRSKSMLPLPLPVAGGTVTELARFLNVTRTGFMLCVAWLIAALAGMKPFPLLAIGGREGNGKSSAVSVMQLLIDPHAAERRRTPGSEQDLFIAARSAYVLPFDNLSGIPEWLSDTLCVLSTGGTFTTRSLYTNDEETVLVAQRPVILNGIPDLLARPDLAERALMVTLQAISDDQRMTEEEFWGAFEEARPRLFGALLDALAGGLQRLPDTKPPRLPRQADFARLIVATEPNLPWDPGTFMHTFNDMQVEAAGSLLEDEPVADAIQVLLDDVGRWEGTVKDLLSVIGLKNLAVQDGRPPKRWPRTPKALGVDLRRLGAALAKCGYDIGSPKRTKSGQVYLLTKAEPTRDNKSSAETEPF